MTETNGHPASADLVAALGELSNPTKEGSAGGQGGRNWRYLELADLLATIRPVFAKHHLAVMQDATRTPDGVSVITAILHADGSKWQSSALEVPSGRDIQSIGSAITYAKRYQLSAYVGLAGEDDDGQAAQQATKGNAAEFHQTKAVQRSPKRADDPADRPYQTPPTPPPVMRPAPVEPGELGDLGSPSQTNPARETHVRKLWAMLNAAGLREDNQRRAWVGAFLAIEPGWHWNELTTAQVSAAIDRLKSEPLPVDVGPDRPRAGQ